MRPNSICPKCGGMGAMLIEGTVPARVVKCKRCKGLGRVKLNIQERTESRKYGDVIQPVRELAIENSGLRGTLRGVTKKYAKCRYKRNKQARSIKNQGQYIEKLKKELKELKDRSER